jgi:hypothetical protein
MQPQALSPRRADAQTWRRGTRAGEGGREGTDAASGQRGETVQCPLASTRWECNGSTEASPLAVSPQPVPAPMCPPHPPSEAPQTVWTQIACLALTLENADGQQCVLPSLSGLARIDFSLPLCPAAPRVSCPRPVRESERSQRGAPDHPARLAASASLQRRLRQRTPGQAPKAIHRLGLPRAKDGHRGRQREHRRHSR